MKILHILSSNKYSGAENVAAGIISNFKDFDMLYVSHEGPIIEALKQRKIKYRFYNSFNELRKIIEEYEPDIIHAHDLKASMLTCFLRKYPVISHIHFNSQEMRKNSIKSILFFLTTYRYKKIIWVSEAAMLHYKFYRFIKGKCIFMHNIKFDLQTAKKESGTTKKIDLLFVGRLEKQKNPVRFLKIVKEVVLTHSIRAVMVGDGSLSEECRAYISQNQLDKHVSMHGYVYNVTSIYEESKLLMMTSVFEGMPMAILEAMSFGLPIISTNFDGVLEIIDQGETGYVSDDDDVLVEKIISLLEDEQKMNIFSNNSKKKFNIYNNITEYCVKLKQIYNSALPKKLIRRLM